MSLVRRVAKEARESIAYRSPKQRNRGSNDPPPTCSAILWRSISYPPKRAKCVRLLAPYRSETPSSRSGAGAVVNHRSPTKLGDSGVRPRAALILGSVSPRLFSTTFQRSRNEHCYLRGSLGRWFPRDTVTREDPRRVRERGKREKERKENKVKNRVELGVAARETINKTIINFPIYF